MDYQNWYNKNNNEITLRVVILSIILAIILAIANAYLALKIGLLASASIPAAILSMGILNFFKKASIYEHNLIQTAASAGEAVSGGIVFTIPALIILGYWHFFPYWENFCIALMSSYLGILLSIPLRRFLLKDSELPFPEGKAVAEVLKVGDQKNQGFKEILSGALFGAAIEGLQATKLMSSTLIFWKKLGGTIVGVAFGFSAMLIGAGYLMGAETALSIMLGGIVAWLFGIPVLSHLKAHQIYNLSPDFAVNHVLIDALREIGISVMLLSGIVTILLLAKQSWVSLKQTNLWFKKNKFVTDTPEEEKDLPAKFQLGLFVILICATGLFLSSIIPFAQLQTYELNRPEFIVILLIFLMGVGFILSSIAAYFSGLVGVSASPGSAIVIAGMLLSGLLIKLLLLGHPLSNENQLQLLGAAITVILGSFITGMACIANDNIQDLKVGQLIGATPWKQQTMLLLGALIASAVVPLVMELLYNTYGIANVVPRPFMDANQSLPAPPAAIMAMLAKSIFQQKIDFVDFGWGGLFFLINIVMYFTAALFKKRLSLLAMAVGMYLPLTSSSALFIGGCIAWQLNRFINKQSAAQQNEKRQLSYLIACGIVVGSILVDVMTAAVHSINTSLNFTVNISTSMQTIYGVIVIIVLWLWWYKKIKTTA